MKYFFWRFLGRRFWIKLRSHWSNKDGYFYSEWKQKKGITKNHYQYKLCGINPKGIAFNKTFIKEIS